MRLGFTLVLPCLAARPAGPGKAIPPGLPAARLQCAQWAKGSASPPSPGTPQLSLSSPCLHSAGGRGPERLRCCCWVPAARGSACLLPQRGVILPTARPRGAGTFACLPCMRPRPGWSLLGISRVSSSYHHCPRLAAHRPGWRLWERTPPPSHGCPGRGNTTQLSSLHHALRTSILWLLSVFQVENFPQLANIPPLK